MYERGTNFSFDKGCMPEKYRKDIDDNGACYLISKWVIPMKQARNLIQRQIRTVYVYMLLLKGHVFQDFKICFLQRLCPREGHHISRLGSEQMFLMQLPFFIKRGQPWLEELNYALM